MKMVLYIRTFYDMNIHWIFSHLRMDLYKNIRISSHFHFAIRLLCCCFFFSLCRASTNSINRYILENPHAIIIRIRIENGWAYLNSIFWGCWLYTSKRQNTPRERRSRVLTNAPYGHCKHCQNVQSKPPRKESIKMGFSVSR